MTEQYTSQQILALPMEENDADAETIGQYLVTLAQACWLEGEGFSGKRPFGNSNWQSDIWKALIKADAVSGHLDEYGDVDDISDHDVDSLLREVFQHMMKSDFSIPPEPEDWYVVHLGRSPEGNPVILDTYLIGYTEKYAKALAKELNDEVPGRNWIAHHIPK